MERAVNIYLGILFMQRRSLVVTSLGGVRIWVSHFRLPFNVQEAAKRKVRIACSMPAPRERFFFPSFLYRFNLTPARINGPEPSSVKCLLLFRVDLSLNVYSRFVVRDTRAELVLIE